MKFQPTVAQASIAAGETAHLRYVIEEYDYLPIYNGKKVTLRFWARSTVTGTFCVSFRNNAVNRSLVKEYTINQANTWELKHIYFVTDTEGSWVLGVSAGMYINWSFAMGSTYQSPTKDSWVNGNYLATSNQTNFFSSTSNEMYITGIMLYEGWEECPTFFRAGRNISEETNYCLRYYEKTKITFEGYAASGYYVGMILSYFQKRGETPEVTTISSGTDSGNITQFIYYQPTGKTVCPRAYVNSTGRCYVVDRTVQITSEF